MTSSLTIVGQLRFTVCHRVKKGGNLVLGNPQPENLALPANWPKSIAELERLTDRYPGKPRLTPFGRELMAAAHRAKYTNVVALGLAARVNPLRIWELTHGIPVVPQFTRKELQAIERELGSPWWEDPPQLRL